MGAKILKVLIVDDNQDLAESLAFLVRVAGHHALVAYDAGAGLRLAQQMVPDLIVHDIGLPDMSGYEAARRLRKQIGLRDAVLVAHTAYCSDYDKRRAKEAGFDNHVTKPMDPAFLCSMLKRVAAGGSLKRELSEKGS